MSEPPTSAVPVSSEPAPWPRRGPAWWLLAILFLASIVSILDRNILSIVAEPLKNDLSLTDVQLGLLQGLAFGLFYATVGVPLGLIADRHSRRWLIIVGVSVWSAATAFAGFATGFGELFLARILVGLGEAALAPAAISMIADLFPPKERGRPISIYLTGQAVANGLSISVTSYLLAAASAGSFASTPLLAQLAPWRIAFICCGALGIIVVLALLTTREPVRRALAPQHRDAQSARAAFTFLTQNRAVFIPLYLGFALCFMAAYGAAAWMPTMLRRSYAATNLQIGQWLGPMQMVFSLLGPVTGGALVDRYARLGQPLMKFRVLCLAPLLALPAAFAAFAPNPIWAMALAASITLPIAATGTTLLASLQSMVPPQMRGIAISLTGLVNTVIGATLGPLLIAMVTERFFGDPAKLGVAIAMVVAPALLLGSLMFTFALRALREQQQTGGQAAALTSQLD